MNYNDVISKIHSFKRLGSRLGLERMKRLLQLLGNPHQGMKVIHVAGTNGKGSVCRYLYSILQTQGYKTGLYTSPFLERFTERIEFNGKEIEQSELIESASSVFEQVDTMIANGEESPTEFEIITAIAFYYYSRQNLDYLILEVGLGGRGDATNVIETSLVSVITSIDYDHTEYLGDTLEKIAFEKSGIIKKNCPVVVCVKDRGALAVIRERAENQSAPFIPVPYDTISDIKSDLNGYSFNFLSNDYKTGMLGAHQVENAATAITVIEQLRAKGIKISQEALLEGLLRAKQNGRFEIIERNPLTIIDGAHNISGMMSLRKTISELLEGKKILLCIGLLRDKDIDEILDIIVPIVHEVVVTEPKNDRKIYAYDLERKLKEYHVPIMNISDIRQAKAYIIKNGSNFDGIVYAGSLYLIGAIRSLYKNP